MTNTPTNIDQQIQGLLNKDFNYADAPALHPDVVVTRVKEVYDKVLIGRSLIGSMPVQGDSVSYILEGDMTGAVDWITEEGGFPKVDFKYEKRSKVIRPYGQFFDVTMQERKFSRIPTVNRKITRAVRAMRKFEDDMIFYDLLNNSSKNTFDGSNWSAATGSGMGDPVADLEKAKRLVRDATEGIEPDIAIMSSQMFEYLTKFDTVRNALYHSSRYAETGNLNVLAGLKLVVNNQVDPAGTSNHVLVMKQGEAGYMAESIGLTTPSVDGLSLSNPLVDRRYFLYAQAEPVIDSPETYCLITGLADANTS